jgi:membrane fusion protein (multidrug efflux system)/multidrug efflux system membrane fusion protein
VIVQRKLDPGALVGPATGPILTVARTDVMRVFVGVNERDAVDVALGQQVQVTVDALPEKNFSGPVIRFAPAFDPMTRTLDVEVDLPNPTGFLRPGMFGRAAIRVGLHKDAVVLPVSAVQVNENAAFVFVVGAGNKVQRRKVELGVDGGDWLEIVKGLKPGDRVVTVGIDGLSDGALVRLEQNEALPELPVARESTLQ